MSADIEFTVPEEHPCFAGHFPGDPLVPGALLLTWCLAELGRHRPQLAVTGVRQFKFLAPVRPGAPLRLTCGEPGRRLSVSLYCADELAGKGQLECAE